MVAMVLALVLGTAAAAEAPALIFERQKIGEATFEAASVFDVDKDGALDIVSGGFWYAGPAFTEAHKIADIAANGDYFDDFASYPLDVNGDGWTDILTGAWWGMAFQWRENPGEKGGEWTTHEVAKVGNVERLVMADIDGDGHVEVLATTAPFHYFKLNRDTRQFEQHTIDPGPGGHGQGAGDINGDGRTDILFATGWLEAPADPYDTAGWTFHDEWILGLASVPILAHDVNEDGRMDIIAGQGHNYGLAWYEQGKNDAGERIWIQHDIDKVRSQFHDIQLADIDNDGALELVTGKRWRAHSGADPGANDPLGVYYFELNKGDFVRYTIDYGKPDVASGVGIYFWVEDVDGNGWKDIVAPGKEGLYLFKNLGPAPATN